MMLYEKLKKPLISKIMQLFRVCVHVELIYVYIKAICSNWKFRLIIFHTF